MKAGYLQDMQDHSQCGLIPGAVPTCNSDVNPPYPLPLIGVWVEAFDDKPMWVERCGIATQDDRSVDNIPHDDKSHLRWEPLREWVHHAPLIATKRKLADATYATAGIHE